MEVGLAGEEVARRQPHERQARPVGAAAYRVRARLEAGAADRLARAVGDVRVAGEHLFHVAVRLPPGGPPRPPAAPPARPALPPPAGARGQTRARAAPPPPPRPPPVRHTGAGS